MRVAPPRIFPEATRAARPAPADPSADAYRQTGFVLGGDLDLVLEGLALEGAMAQALAGPRTRTQGVAAVLAFWSRGWLTRLDALHAVETGNYVAAVGSVRAAADYIAAAVAMLATGGEEWRSWVEEGGVGLAPSQHALEYRLHPFRSAESLAANPALGEVYRAASDLALPHFGSTLLLAGNGSDANRVAVTFGDRDFHMALAELAFGWLLALSSVQVAACADERELFAVGEAAGPVPEFRRRVAAALARPERCRVEFIEADGVPRTLVHNVRRAPAGAPVRVLL